MTFYALVSLINGLSATAIGASIVLKRHYTRAAKVFVWFLIAMSAWSYAYFIWQISNNAASALFWAQALSIVTYFLPVLFCHWILSWLDLSKTLWRKIALIIGYVVALLFAVLTPFTNLMVAGVMRTQYFPYWPKAGALYALYPLGLFAFFVVIMTIELIRAYRREQGLRKHQIRFVLLGVFFTVLGGGTNFPLWFNIPVPPIGNIFVTIGMLTIFYGFVRYRLMDMRAISIEVLIYLADAALVYTFFYIYSILSTELYGGIFTEPSFLSGLILAPLFVFLLIYFDKLLRHWCTKHLFLHVYEYKDTIADLSIELNRYLDLQKIVDLIVDTIKETMHLNRAGILLIEPDQNRTHYKIAKVIGFDTSNGISLVEDSFLTQHLQKIQRVLVRDELRALYLDSTDEHEKEDILRIEEQMEHIEASLCIPLMSRGQVVGIIVLGSKISGEPYTKDDLHLLNTLGKQAGMAIENAWLYKKVQTFYETLAERVDEQTNQILKKNLYLEELLHIKDEFLRTVNHQLNTPISIMKAAFAMMSEGSMTQEQGMETIKQGFERIDNTVADFWRALELEGGERLVKPEPLNTKEIIEEKIKRASDLKEAKDRKLTITLEQKEDIPMVICDKRDFEYIIGNLLSNAVYYTESGGVTVSFKRTNDKLSINIIDTGHGFSDEDKERLFKKFTRGESAISLKPDGSGLGLYITKKLVESNRGTVTAYSEGLLKGTTFTVTLPTKLN